jgi:hypothetical protein
MSEKYLVLDGPLKGRSYARPEGSTCIQIPVMAALRSYVLEIETVTYKLHQVRQTWTTPSWAGDTFYWKQAS